MTEYSPAKTVPAKTGDSPQLKLGNIREYSPILKIARIAKKIWRTINTIALIWDENMLGYLSLDIICSS